MFRICLACILTCFISLSNTQQFADMTALTGFSDPGRNHGMSVADFNRDGLDDIYVSRREGPNKLYINTGNFSFREDAAGYGLDYPGDTNCSLWWDYDNDGDLDLYLGNKFENTVLYRNDGQIFTDVTEQSKSAVFGNLRSLNAADIDNDGDLDLYIALAARQNVLLLNDGGVFRDVTLEYGIDDTGSSMGAVFLDYDQDGWIDLYQTRDGNQGNLMYRNKGNGYFEDVSDQTNTDLKGMGMGVDVAYINDDAYPDLYVTNLYDNFLLLNNGNGRFANVASERKVNDRGMGWGTFVFDADNDRNGDIYVANESGFPVDGKNLPSRLFMGTDYFVFQSEEKAEGVQNMYSSYGAATGDFDNDGLLDIVVANQGDDGNQIFRNRNEESFNHIKFRLLGNVSNTMGVGARIDIYHEAGRQSDILTAGAGYASQNSPVVHFGLGTVNTVDSVVISWPSGIRQRITRPEVNVLNLVREGESLPLRGPLVWTEPPFPTQSDDVTVYFDAKEGNGALAGFDGPVFAHTGLITNQSTSATDWKNVIGNWGSFDTRTLMSDEGNDIYSLSYNISSFYDIDPGTVVEKLAFVFRNADGSIVGRDTDGSDIFLDIFEDQDALLVNIISPRTSASTIYVENDIIPIVVELNREARIVVTDNGDPVLDTRDINVDFPLNVQGLGEHELVIEVSDSTDVQRFSFSYLVINQENVRQDPPQDTENGLNYRGSGFSYIFRLYAPGKKHVFLLCPKNSYQVDENYRLKNSLDGSTFWIELPRTLFENGGNTYQYLVDGEIKISDPFSEVILDPFDDGAVDASVMAELPDYPETMTERYVTAFDLDKPEYDWQTNDFEAPAREDLVIYELLIRDYLGNRRYTSLIDTLDYLERLGVNAIELMPIQEFSGNDSWGYNPGWHMAVDKYYGSRNELRRFIDEAHKRGIAVILDVVFNHCTNRSPLAELYWNDGLGRPADNSPYLNTSARHPFNVFNDVNHESEATKYWVKRVLTHWIEEFRFDGFRFDLSKGMTQTNSGNDAGLMSRYDASRIAILKDYADHIWSLDPDNYVILEHFADNDEEKELADYGMMLWGNMNHQFSEAAMGFPSDLEWTDYKVRGWSAPHIVAYMESHDEERMMYRCLNFGDTEGDYSTRRLNTALERVAAASALFYSIPGPKMLWQFGELGYDFSINRCSDGSVSNDCRLTPKPIKWDYLENYYRNRLFNIVSSLIYLKTNYPSFSTDDYTFNDGNFYIKTVHLNHPDMDAVCLVNFRVTDTEINPKFQYPGIWYEYFTGDSLNVSNVNEKLPFLPGEYRIYTSKRIVPPSGFLSSAEEWVERRVSLFPNPVSADSRVTIELEEATKIDRLELISVTGQSTNLLFRQSGYKIHADIPAVITSGYYLVRLSDGNRFSIHKLLIH